MRGICQHTWCLSVVCLAPVFSRFLSFALDGEGQLISNAICLCHSWPCRLSSITSRELINTSSFGSWE